MPEIIEAKTQQDGRVVLDTTVSSTRIASVGAMNGHEGDNGRMVHFKTVGALQRPYNLENKTVDLVGADSAGKIKVGGHYQPVNPEYGIFDFLLPGAFYQQTGDYAKAYFRIKDKNDQVVSTINVMFTVIAGVGVLTSGDDQIYDGYIEDKLAEVERKVDQYTAATNQMISGNQAEVTAMRSIVDNMITEINNHEVATLAGDNHFTGKNVFDNLSSPSLEAAIKQAQQAAGNVDSKFNSFSDAMTQKFSGGLPKYTDFWSRDYTLGANLSRPAANPLAISRFKLADHCYLIWGRGDVIVNHNGGDQYWETSITLPWKINTATFYLGDWHTWKGYFKPYHPISTDNVMPVSCTGNNFSNEQVSIDFLLISDGGDE